MLRFLGQFQADYQLKSGWIEPLLVGGHAPFSPTDGTDSNEGLTNGDCSNGILSFLALSPVFSFHISIKVGLWILTEPTASFTRRSSWMKREKSVIMSWIR